MHLSALPLGLVLLMGPVPESSGIREVWMFENLAFSNAGTPFLVSGPELIPQSDIPDEDTLLMLARANDVVFEICPPRWRFAPRRTLEDRRENCVQYGESVETRQQP